MVRLNRFGITMVWVAVSVLLSGCRKDVQIFKTDEEISEIKSSDTLEFDTYYIKNGTKFYPTYNPKGNTSGYSSAVDDTRVVYTVKDGEKIPVHYKGEIVAYCSKSADGLESVTLERFKDLGYSIGVYGGYYDYEDEYYHVSSENNNIVKGSEFENAVSQTISKELRIVSIGGEKVSPEMVDTSGVFIGLEKGRQYDVTFFSGTRFYETMVTADVHFYGSFEMMNYDGKYIKDTTNGYIEFDTPKDLKSGYYAINGNNMFRYIAVEKSESLDIDAEGIDYNEPYYADERQRREAYSKAYSINIPSKAKDVRIDAKFSGYDSNTDAAKISGIVYSPDGTRYDMDVDEKEGVLSLDLMEAMPGRWEMSITPKSLEVSFDVSSSISDEELTEVDKIINVEEPCENMLFSVKYETFVEDGGDIYGMVISADNETYPMTPIKYKEKDASGDETEVKKLIYEAPYLKAGQYEVKVYYRVEEVSVEAPELTENLETIIKTIIVD